MSGDRTWCQAWCGYVAAECSRRSVMCASPILRPTAGAGRLGGGTRAAAGALRWARCRRGGAGAAASWRHRSVSIPVGVDRAGGKQHSAAASAMIDLQPASCGGGISSWAVDRGPATGSRSWSSSEPWACMLALNRYLCMWAALHTIPAHSCRACISESARRESGHAHHL
jgi:hypothetical protein